MHHVFNTVHPKFICRVDPFGLIPKGNLKKMITAEKQFFNSTPDYIHNYQDVAPLTYKVLKIFRKRFVQEDDDYYSLVVNTHCHILLTEGMSPGIPGWHCDYSRQDKEGDRISLEEDENVIHWLYVFGIDNPPTFEFIEKNKIKINDENLKTSTWRSVSQRIDRRVQSGWITKRAKENEVYEFRGNELYRLISSNNKCWRMQIRITMYPKGHKYRPEGCTGNIRNLQMVYVDCDGIW